jgi:hypothetical protein
LVAVIALTAVLFALLAARGSVALLVVGIWLAGSRLALRRAAALKTASRA